MQPRSITLPDPLRDALERDLKRAFPKNPVINKTSGHEKEIDACKQIVAWHLFGIAPENPDLVTGASADHKTDPETKQFLKEFYQAYLGMECGTSSPVLQIENLPPKYGTQFNIGLMDGLTNAKNGGGLKILGVLANIVAQPTAHRDLPKNARINQLKTIQSLYCKSPGAIAQPTVFVSIDEALDLLAKNEGGNFTEARQRWVERLSAIRIKDYNNEIFRLITPNSAAQYGDTASSRTDTPKHILYTHGRLVNNIDDLAEANPEKRAQQQEDYGKFSDALNSLIHENAAAATGSRKANTMLLWNDALVLHDRGPQLAKGAQKNRKLFAIEGNHQPYPEQDNGLTYAIGGPCSQVSLDQLRKLGTSAPVNQHARTS